MKKCIECGFELDDTDAFCAECGARQPEKKKCCHNCGAELMAGAKFCVECGTPVGANTQSAHKQGPSLSTTINDDVDVDLPDDDTIRLTVKGVSFNLKFVKGEKYATGEQIPDFFLGETKVTQALWMAVMGSNPSIDNDSLDFPVCNITPQDITVFLNHLNKLTGVRFELQHIRSRIYAQKGGTLSKGYQYPGSDNMTEVVWKDGKLHPVGQLNPNELGLYDMEGNAEEYTSLGIDCSDINVSLRLYLEIPAGEFTMKKDNLLEGAISLRHAEFKQCIEEASERLTKEKNALLAKAKSKTDTKFIDFKYKRGILEYAPSNECPTPKQLQMMFGEEYIKYLNEENALRERVDKALRSADLEWHNYYKRRFTYICPTLQFALIDNGKTMIIKGEKMQPPSQFDREKLNDFLIEKSKNVENIVVLDGMTNYGRSYDLDLSKLKIAILPQSIREIEYHSFKGAKVMPYIVLPNELSMIREGAFSGCSNLKAIFIPPSIEKVGWEAFAYNTELRKVIIPKGKVDSTVFYGCCNLKN